MTLEVDLELETFLEASLANLGASWANLAPFWAHFGLILGQLGSILGPFWKHFGASWEHLDMFFCLFQFCAHFVAHFGLILGSCCPSWPILGSSWAHLGLILGSSWAPFGYMLAQVGALWHILEQILTIMLKKSKSLKNTVLSLIFNDFWPPEGSILGVIFLIFGQVGPSSKHFVLKHLEPLLFKNCCFV